MAEDRFLQQEMIKAWTSAFHMLRLIPLLHVWQANWLI